MFKNNSKNKSKSCIPPGKYIGLCQSLIWRFNLISSRFLPNLVPKSSISKSSASNNAVSKSSHELCWSHLWLWWQLFPNQDRDLNSNVAMSTSDFELLEVQSSSTWEMTWEWSWYLLNPSYINNQMTWKMRIIFDKIVPFLANQSRCFSQCLGVKQYENLLVDFLKSQHFGFLKVKDYLNSWKFEKKANDEKWSVFCFKDTICLLPSSKFTHFWRNNLLI